MRTLTQTEILSLREMLQMETNALAIARLSIMAIQDPDLKDLGDSGIVAAENRIKGLQRFINENNVLSMREVH